MSDFSGKIALEKIDPSIGHISKGLLNSEHELITRMFLGLQMGGCPMQDLRTMLTQQLAKEDVAEKAFLGQVQGFRKTRAHFLQRLFRNNSGFGTNYLYLRHLNDCAMAASGKNVQGYMESQFYETGVGHLVNVFDPSNLAQRVGSTYDKMVNCAKNEGNGYKMISFDTKDLSSMVGEFCEVFYGPVEKFFLEQFGTFPQLYVGHAAVTEVANTRVASEYPGNDWHSDESPISLIKGFFYLCDVARDSGATRYLSRKVSDEWMEKGFFSSTLESRLLWDKQVEDWLCENPDSLNYMEGQAGDIFFFDPNLLHKATHPRRSPRIGLHLVFYPGKSRQTLDEVYRALYSVIVTQSGTKDFPVDPYVNDIQNMFHLIKKDKS